LALATQRAYRWCLIEETQMPQPSPGPFNLSSTYLRLRGDTSIEPLHVGNDFWPALMSGQLGTFHHEFLVTTFGYDSPWPNWEMHPNGDEIVLLLDGRATMVLEIDGREQLAELKASGDYVLVPRGTWHTSRASTPCRMLFITAGEGTEHRPAQGAKRRTDSGA
jgi:mannose-6-phosphate isomerase-like protein (cupin superfamily)